MQRTIDTAAILRTSFALARENRAAAALAWLALAALSTLADMIETYGNAMSLGVALAAIMAQFGLTRALLRSQGLGPSAHGPARGGAFVIALILVSLGMAIGFVLLILPGVYLWARWSLVAPLVAGERMRALEAIGESWSRTKALVAPISAALVLLSVPLFVGAVLLMILAGDRPSIGASLFINLLTYGAQVLMWVCSVAIYALTVADPPSDLEQVFA